MNDDLNLLRQLEQATAAGDDWPGESDAETAALREGWLAFAKLVGDAGLRPNPAPLRWQPETHKPTRRTSHVVALVIAASLIFVVALATGRRFHTQDGAVLPSPQQFVEKPVEPRVTPKVPKIENAPRQPLVATADTARWDDAIDEQITATSQAVVQAGDDLFAQASAIQQRLESMQLDLDGNPL